MEDINHRNHPSPERGHGDGDENRGSSNLLTAMKLIAATALFYSAGTSFAETYHLINQGASGGIPVADLAPADLGMSAPSTNLAGSGGGGTSSHSRGRRLSEISKKNPPSYMKDLVEELKARRKLMEETPPDEVKYWFEYTGPLQVRERRTTLLRRKEREV